MCCVRESIRRRRYHSPLSLSSPKPMSLCHHYFNQQHARRLYPLQISPKKILEWAYYQDEKEKWTVIDKSILTEKPSEEGTTTSTPVKLDGIEKLIGFEGRPDPASGYYCVYDGGRLQRDKVQSYFKESYYKEQD